MPPDRVQLVQSPCGAVPSGSAGVQSAARRAARRAQSRRIDITSDSRYCGQQRKSQCTVMAPLHCGGWLRWSQCGASRCAALSAELSESLPGVLYSRSETAERCPRRTGVRSRTAGACAGSLRRWRSDRCRWARPSSAPAHAGPVPCRCSHHGDTRVVESSWWQCDIIVAESAVAVRSRCAIVVRGRWAGRRSLPAPRSEV